MKITTKEVDDEDEDCVGLVLSRQEALALAGGYGRSNTHDIVAGANVILGGLSKHEYFVVRTIETGSIYSELKSAIQKTFK